MKEYLVSADFLCQRIDQHVSITRQGQQMHFTRYNTVESWKENMFKAVAVMQQFHRDYHKTITRATFGLMDIEGYLRAIDADGVYSERLTPFTEGNLSHLSGVFLNDIARLFWNDEE